MPHREVTGPLTQGSWRMRTLCGAPSTWRPARKSWRSSAFQSDRPQPQLSVGEHDDLDGRTGLSQHETPEPPDEATPVLASRAIGPAQGFPPSPRPGRAGRGFAFRPCGIGQVDLEKRRDVALERSSLPPCQARRTRTYNSTSYILHTFVLAVTRWKTASGPVSKGHSSTLNPALTVHYYSAVYTDLGQHVAHDVADGRDDYRGGQNYGGATQKLERERKQLYRLHRDNVGCNQHGNEQDQDDDESSGESHACSPVFTCWMSVVRQPHC